MISNNRKLPQLEVAKDTTDFEDMRLLNLRTTASYIHHDASAVNLRIWDQRPVPKAQAAAQAEVLPQPLLTEQTLRQLSQTRNISKYCQIGMEGKRCSRRSNTLQDHPPAIPCCEFSHPMFNISDRLSN